MSVHKQKVASGQLIILVDHIQLHSLAYVVCITDAVTDIG